MVYFAAFLSGALAVPLLPVRSWSAAAAVLSLVLLVLLAAKLTVHGAAHQSIRSGRANDSSEPIDWLLRRLLVAVLACSLGGSLAAIGVKRVVDAQLPEPWQGRDIELEGRVLEVADQSRTFARFYFLVTGSGDSTFTTQLQGRKLRLSWYYGEAPATGEVWQLKVRMKRPRGFINPRGFDYGAWLLSQQVVATGYVREGKRAASSRPASPQQLLDGIRGHLSTRLFSGDGHHYGFFKALLLGDKTGINAEQWRVLQRTGTIHLMAISGLHVGLVAALGFGMGWLFTRVLSLTGLRLSLWLVRLVPPLSSCLTAAAYSALAGFSIPTQRALVVVLLVNLALILGRRPSALGVLSIAGVLVVLGAPLAPTQAGFWLSFSAVFVLILGFAWRPPARTQWPLVTPVLGLIKAQLLLAVGLLGPLLALGSTISLAGPFANLVAVPVVSLLIVPGLLLSVALATVANPAALVLIAALDWIYGLLWTFLEVMSEVSWAQWWPSVPVTTAMVVALATAALCLLMPRGLKTRLPGIVLLGLAVAAPRASVPQLQVTAVEVGQGTAVVVKLPGYTLLYDTGPSFSSDFDAGSRIILPYLQSLGVHHLNSLVVSHGDNDHAGGVAGILRDMSVDKLLLSPDQLLDGATGAACEAGQGWQQDGVSFSIVWPPAGWQAGTTNDNSCVLLIEWEGARVLLAGDIEAGAEDLLLKSDVLPSNVSLLVAPHHGSKTSSTQAFVDHIRPAAVIFTAGYQNRYGHPHPDVVARYRRAGSEVYTTGNDGAVSVVWQKSGEPARITRARQQIGRAWY